MYRDQLWCNVERHAWPIVYKVVGIVCCLTTVNICGSAVASVAKSVQKGEFAEMAAVGCGRKRLVGREWKRIQLSRPSRRGHRIVSLGTMYIHTVSDAEGVSL